VGGRVAVRIDVQVAEVAASLADLDEPGADLRGLQGAIAAGDRLVHHGQPALRLAVVADVPQLATDTLRADLQVVRAERFGRSAERALWAEPGLEADRLVQVITGLRLGQREAG